MGSHIGEVKETAGHPYRPAGHLQAIYPHLLVDIAFGFAVPIGHKWRVLPPEHGKWNSIFKRFSRWCASGAWGKLLGHFSEEAGLQDVSIDGKVIRAHACAAGAVGSSGEVIQSEINIGIF